MKVEINVPDEMVAFFEAEARMHGATLAQLLTMKVFAQRHDSIARSGIPAAPREVASLPSTPDAK